MDSAVILATLTAEYDLRETMLARVASALAILGCVHSAPSGQFLLHQKEDVLRYLSERNYYPRKNENGVVK